MKNLLYAVIGGAVCWIVSEIIELSGGGFSTASLVVTLAAFLLLAIGFWGLHKSQSPGKNMPSLIGAGLMVVAFALFTIVTLQLMMTGATEEYAGDSLFAFGALAMVAGAIIFGVSVLKAKYYPAWMGIAMILLVVLVLAVEAFALPSTIQNISNIVLSLTFLLMGVRALHST